MIPPPKKVEIDGKHTHCSLFDTGIVLNMDANDLKNRTNQSSLVLPPMFVSRCKDLMNKHVEDIRSWFTPSPSLDTLRNVIHYPSVIPYSLTGGIANAVLKVKGIIVESSRILPYITLDLIPLPSLTKSLVIDNSSEIEEITDDIIIQDVDNACDTDENESDESGSESDESDTDEDDDARFERVQRNLDDAREELERLRRTRARK